MRLIKNGQVLIDNRLEKKDILIDEGKIIQIDDSILKDCDTVDATGLTVIPGLVDVHVHFREPGHSEKETIHTGSLAAAHGGFTSVFAMPNVIPFPDDVDTMKDYQQLIKKESVVHTYPYACITLEEASKEVVDMKGIKELGVRWFSDDGVGVATPEIMKEAMEKAKDVENTSYRYKPSKDILKFLESL